MDERAFALMAEVELRHWWWVGRRAIIGRVLRSLARRRALPSGMLYDLGCGVGSNLPVLGDFGAAVGIDASEEAVSLAHSLGRTNVRRGDLSRADEPLPAAQGTGAVALLADVLEHLDEEDPALAIAEQLLVPGGVLLVTVPALPALWGPADTFNHHRRRYTPRTLAAIIGRRFAIERLTFFNTFLLAPIAAARWLSRLAPYQGSWEPSIPPRPLNAMLGTVFSLEAPLLERVDLPLGVSLLCVARKRAGGR